MQSMVGNVPLRKYFCKVPCVIVSKKLLYSIKTWWEKHGNIHAGCMLGTYEGFYSQNPSEGMVTFNKIVEQHNDKLAIYIANILARLRECSNSPLQDYSTFLQPGGEHSMDTNKSDLKWMLVAAVCISSKEKEYYTTCKVNGEGHNLDEFGDYNYRDLITCPLCYCDAETRRFTSLF